MRRFILRYFACLVAAGVLLALLARTGAAFSPWSYFDTTSGLVENTVQIISPDGAGGLWLGTRGGLSHYDGGQWRSFTTADGLPDNDINSIFVDSSGRLWIGTRSGFGLFHEGRWSRLGLPGGGGTGQRVVIVTDREGNVWFGYSGGLMKFDTESRALEVVSEMEGKAVRSLVADRSGRLWVGTNSDLRLFDGTFWEIFTVRDGLPPGPVTALLEDSQGSMWCGTEDGLGEYDEVGWENYGQRDGLPNTHVTALAEDREGRVWVGTRDGAGYNDGYDWIWVDSRGGLPGNNVLTLSTGVNGSVWIGTAHGLAKYDTSWVTLTDFDHVGRSPRAPLFRNPGGKVYLGADSGFLERSGRQVDYIGLREGLEGRVGYFYDDSEGDLWIGTDHGLYVYSGGALEHFMPSEYRTKVVQVDEARWEAKKHREFDRFRGLMGEVVTAVSGDGEEAIWVGTTEGLSRYRDGTWDFLEENGTPAKAEISALILDREERLWVGTRDGLWLQRDEGWTRFGRSGGLAGDRINCLTVDRDGRLWVGTERGASRLEGQAWQTVNVGGGLNGPVWAIFQASSGSMWFGTPAGVAKFNGHYWSTFGENDGLHANDITSIMEVDGYLWFGSKNGVSTYRPDRAFPNTRIKNPPQQVVGGPTYLFEFAAGDLETQLHQMRYSYRLDDGDWSPFTPESRVSVTDLENGTHTFSVRSMDRELNIDPTPAVANFEVNTGLFDLELVQAEFQALYAALYQYYANDPDYRQRPIGRLLIRSKYDRPLRVKVSLFVQDLMDFPTDQVVSIQPGEELSVPLRIEFNSQILALEETSTRQIRLKLQYNLHGKLKESQSTHPVTILERHSMTWEEPERIGLYVTHLDEVVEGFARGVVRQFAEVEKKTIIYDNLLRGIELFDALGAHGVRYLADPENPYFGIAAGNTVLDVVRFPRETLQLKSGDCDDIAVLYAALLQNIGIDTTLVDVFDHVFVMFDTGLKKSQLRQLVRDRELLYVDERERVWVPVEITLLGKDFTTAWRKGASTLRNQRHALIEIKEAWKKYAPLQPQVPKVTVKLPTPEQIWPLFQEDLHLQEEALISPEVKILQQRLDADPRDVAAVNSLGILLAKNGYLGQAAARFRKVIELEPGFSGGHSNLGNVFYEQEDYRAAEKSYLESLKLEGKSPEVSVELALTYCEMGNFEAARVYYQRAMELNPALAPAEGASARR